MKRKFLICLVLVQILLLNSLTVLADGLTPSEQTFQLVTETRENAAELYEYIDSYDWCREIAVANGGASERATDYSVDKSKVMRMYDFGHDYITDWQDGGDEIFAEGPNLWAFPYYFLGEYSGTVVIFDRNSGFSYSIMMTNADPMLNILFTENTLTELLERNNISNVQDCKIILGSYSAMSSVMYINNDIVLSTDAGDASQMIAEEKESFLNGWIMDEGSSNTMGGGGYTRINNVNTDWYIVLIPIIAIWGIICLMRLGIKNKRIKKCVATTLVLIMLLNFFVIADISPKVSAEEIDEPLSVEDLPTSIVNSIDKEKLEDVVITDDNKENLYSFTTTDGSGIKTAYVFNEPIKYVNENGKVKFKSEKTVKSNKLFDTYEFYGEENNVLCYFPKKIKDGIKLEYNGWNLSFTPVTNKNSKPVKKEVTFNGTTEEMIEYTEVFDKYTTLQYKPTINGIKENIVLSQYNGRNTFEFEIDVGALVPAYNEGTSIPLLNPDTKETVYILGQVDARDSFTGENTNNEKHFTLYNSLKLEKAKKGKYILTVTVDKEFLESETTVYPVVIDPVITIHSTFISDATVYSGEPNTISPYTDTLLGVGHSDYDGMAETFMKMTDMSALLGIDPDNLVDVSLVIYALRTLGPCTTIRLRDTYSQWDETTITWNNKPSTGPFISDLCLPLDSPGWYEFPIIKLFRSWLEYARGNGGFSANYGFSLSAYTSETDCVPSRIYFNSAESSEKKPYFYIIYNDNVVSEGVYYIRNVESGMYLDIENRGTASGSNVIQNSFHGAQSQQWRIIKTYDGHYFLRPINSPTRGLDVVNNYSENYSNIQIFGTNYTGVSSQWQIILNTHFTDGSYRLICNAGGKAAVVDGASHAAGANVFQYTYTEGQHRNDDWILERADVSLAVPLIPQAKELWCWAACAEMMARFKNFYISRTQYDAAHYVKPQTYNTNGGTSAETKMAIEYLLNGYYTVNVYNKQIYSPSALTVVLQDSPVEISRGQLNENNIRGSGHAVVIYGFFYDLAGNLHLKIKDPDAELRSDNTFRVWGREYTLSYNDLKRTEEWVWEHVIVFSDASENSNTISADLEGITYVSDD